MSTKSTIKHGDGYHLYHDVFEEDVVFLSINGAQNLEVYANGSRTDVVIAIPNADAVSLGLLDAPEPLQPAARVKEGCDCGCNDPVANTPEAMLRFLSSRFKGAGVADSVAKIYAHDIDLIIEKFYTSREEPKV